MFRMPTHPPSWATVACVSLVLAACTTIVEGTGSRPGGAPVDFDWTSKDGGMTGTMRGDETVRTHAGAPRGGPVRDHQIWRCRAFDELSGVS